eukprot:3658260-Prymnesium_polylepis.3
MLALQTHLSSAVRAAVNVSELAQYLRSFQVLPDEEISRQWLLHIETQAQLRRIGRLIEWLHRGHGFTTFVSTTHTWAS